LAVNNVVAIRNQWKSWCTARILRFNKSFKRNFNRNFHLRSVMWKWSSWTSGVGAGQKIRLRYRLWL